MTPKQERFVAEYLVDLNATQAAIRAGYSKATAKQQGARLLTNADIATATGRGQEIAVNGARMDADAIVGALEDLHQRSFERAAQGDWGVAKGCLELLGKRHAMFTDKQVVDAEVTHHKTAQDIPAASTLPEFLASARHVMGAHLDQTYPTTGGNGNGNGNGNRVSKALADE